MATRTESELKEKLEYALQLFYDDVLEKKDLRHFFFGMDLKRIIEESKHKERKETKGFSSCRIWRQLLPPFFPLFPSVQILFCPGQVPGSLRAPSMEP